MNWLHIPRRLVCKAKDKNKVKIYEQKAILLNLSLYEQRHKVISVWFALVSIHYELKRDKQDLKVAGS